MNPGLTIKNGGIRTAPDYHSPIPRAKKGFRDAGTLDSRGRKQLLESKSIGLQKMAQADPILSGYVFGKKGGGKFENSRGCRTDRLYLLFGGLDREIYLVHLEAH